MESKVWVFWLPSVLINSSNGRGRTRRRQGGGWQRARVAIICLCPLPIPHALYHKSSQVFFAASAGGWPKITPQDPHTHRHTRTQTLCSAGDKFDGKRNYEGVAVVAGAAAAAADDVLPSPILPSLPCKDMTL